MTRTDRLKQLVDDLIERNRDSLDADAEVRVIRLVVTANDGGYARFVAMERCTQQRDESERRPRIAEVAR